MHHTTQCVLPRITRIPQISFKILHDLHRLEIIKRERESNCSLKKKQSMCAVFEELKRTQCSVFSCPIVLRSLNVLYVIISFCYR